MGSANAAAVITMEIFEELQVIPEMRVSLQFLIFT